MAERWHIGKNGPDRCRTQEGKACPLGADVPHGDRESLEAIWQQELEAAYGDGLTGQSRTTSSAETQSDALYTPTAKRVHYSEEAVAVAKRLAAEAVDGTAIAEEDTEWKSDGVTTVRRYRLADGSVGYFKPALENGVLEGHYREYGSTSLDATVAEVNGYRLAQLMGGKYASLVPETALRVIDGKLGSLQREVSHTPPPIEEDRYREIYEERKQSREKSLELAEKVGKLEIDGRLALRSADQDRIAMRRIEFRELTVNPSYKDEVRRAALYEFVAGSLDRHGSNVILEGSGDSAKLKLIDNALSFPPAGGVKLLHKSYLNNKEITAQLGSAKDRKLTDEETQALQNVRAGVQRWIEEGTIERERGEETLKRVDHLLTEGKVEDLTLYMSRRDRALRKAEREAKAAAEAARSTEAD